MASLIAIIGSKGGLALLSWIWFNLAWPVILDLRKARQEGAINREKEKIDSARAGERITISI